METLLVAVIFPPRRVSASAPAFASFHLHHPGRTWSSDYLCWRMLCRRFGLADAFPPLSHWLKFATGGCFAAMVVWVDALPPMLGRRSLYPGRCCLCCMFSCWGLVSCVGRVLCCLRVALLLFVLLLCFLVCVCFSVFLYF